MNSEAIKFVGMQPTSLASRVDITAVQNKLADRLQEWNFEEVLERIVWEGKYTREEAPVAAVEFKKFMFLVGSGYAPIAMISPKIDELWHQLVLFTRRYEVFCNQTVGFFVHHTPETPKNPIPASAAARFLQAYELHFGDLPGIWFAGMTKELQKFYDARPFVEKPPVRWSGWTGLDRRGEIAPTRY